MAILTPLPGLLWKTMRLVCLATSQPMHVSIMRYSMGCEHLQNQLKVCQHQSNNCWTRRGTGYCDHSRYLLDSILCSKVVVSHDAVQVFICHLRFDQARHLQVKEMSSTHFVFKMSCMPKEPLVTFTFNRKTKNSLRGAIYAKFRCDAHAD